MKENVTLKAWVRFKKDNRAVFLTLYNASSPHNVLLQISHDSIFVLKARFAFNRSIADGYWHFVAVSVSLTAPNQFVVLNGETLKTSSLLKFTNTKVLLPASVLSIGSVYNGSTYVDSGFTGQFSQLSLLDTGYDKAMFNCSYDKNGMVILCLSVLIILKKRGLNVVRN